MRNQEVYNEYIKQIDTALMEFKNNIPKMTTQILDSVKNQKN